MFSSFRADYQIKLYTFSDRVIALTIPNKKQAFAGKCNMNT